MSVSAVYDPDVFAFLIPIEEKAITAFALKENKSRYVKHTSSGVAIENIISSRDPTPDPQSPSEEKTKRADRIVLRFSDELKDPFKGIHLGTHGRSDILLGLRGTRGVSARQCTIAVDDNLWVWLHDYESTFGTAVSYDSRLKDEVRCRDSWILAYAPGDAMPWEEIIVNVSGLQFQIIFPNYAPASPHFVASLQAFRDRCKNATPAFDIDLNASSRVSTAAPSQPRTPRKPDSLPLYIDDGFVGNGSYGEVRRVIKARDGLLYAMKQFLPPQADPEADEAKKRNETMTPAVARRDKKRKRDDSLRKNWLDKVQNEYKLMKDNPHPNVMRVLDFQELSNGPVVVMPYYRRGNLANYGPLSEDHCVVILLQLLRGLRHLHRRGVVHRDLKLANLLVDEPFQIVIADFGLSKFDKDEHFITFCGTLETVAPEVFPGNRATPSSPYGTKADVWSVAVIMVELYLNGLPMTPDKKPYKKKRGSWHRWNEKWCNLLFDKVEEQNENDDQLINLLLRMLELDPQKRLSAEECLEKGCQNGLFRKLGDEEYVPVADSAFLLDQGHDRDGTRTPTQQWHQPLCKSILPSFQRTQAGSLGQPSSVEAPTLILPQSTAAATPRVRPTHPLMTAIDGDFWSDIDWGDASEHGNASAIEPPHRRQRLGPGNSNLDNGFDLADDEAREHAGSAPAPPISTDCLNISTNDFLNGELVADAGPAQAQKEATLRPPTPATQHAMSPSSLTTFEWLVAEFDEN